LIVGRGDQRGTERVDRVGPASLRRVRGAPPGDLLQQRAPVLDDLAATLDRQQLSPRLLVDLLSVAQAREVGAEHPQDHRAVLGVVAFDPGVVHRELGVGRGHVDGQHTAAALSVDELSQTPYLQLVARVYRKARRLNPRAPVLRPSPDRSCAN
jgi:hypothetical protein